MSVQLLISQSMEAIESLTAFGISIWSCILILNELNERIASVPHRYVCNFCNTFHIMLFLIFTLCGFLKQHAEY